MQTWCSQVIHTQIMSNLQSVWVNYINTWTPLFVCVWVLQRSWVQSVLRKDLKQVPPKQIILIHFSTFFAFSPLLSSSTSLYLCLIIFHFCQFLYLYLYMCLLYLIYLISGWGNNLMCRQRFTFARLTWDDTNLFITMGSPTDQLKRRISRY